MLLKNKPSLWNVKSSACFVPTAPAPLLCNHIRSTPNIMCCASAAVHRLGLTVWEPWGGIWPQRGWAGAAGCAQSMAPWLVGCIECRRLGPVRRWEAWAVMASSSAIKLHKGSSPGWDESNLVRFSWSFIIEELEGRALMASLRNGNKGGGRSGSQGNTQRLLPSELCWVPWSARCVPQRVP